MYERKAGTVSLIWRQNATSWIKSLGGGTGKIGPSLLARGVLRFLGLPLGILCHHHLCHSSTLIANIRCLNLFLILQWPVCSPSQILFTPIHPRPPLFMVLINIQYPALHCHPLRTHTQRRQLRKKSRLRPEGVMELINMDSRYLFLDDEGPTKNGRSVTPNVGCVFC